MSARDVRENGVTRFKPYPAYKDSGVEWLGEIPAHWVVKRLKYVARLRSGEAITSSDIEESGEYPVYGGNGLRGYTSAFTHDGEFPLIGRQGALCGCINYARGRFWASEHAVVAAPTENHSSKWLGELLRSMSLNRYSESAAQPGLAVETINGLLVPVPPNEEQRAIAAHLDRETATIDALVAKKERLIGLLQEKRTALISRAVTKGLPAAAAAQAGLDPNVPMKDSGVEWLGEIPAHWEPLRLKCLISKPLQYGANEAAELIDPNLPRYIRITDIGDDGSLRDETFRSLPEDVAAQYLLDEGDLLFARSGATVGKTFRYDPSWGTAAYAGYLLTLA